MGKKKVRQKKNKFCSNGKEFKLKRTFVDQAMVTRKNCLEYLKTYYICLGVLSKRSLHHIPEIIQEPSCSTPEHWTFLALGGLLGGELAGQSLSNANINESEEVCSRAKWISDRGHANVLSSTRCKPFIFHLHSHKTYHNFTILSHYIMRLIHSYLYRI